jgi:hypothetical protein
MPQLPVKTDEFPAYRPGDDPLAEDTLNLLSKAGCVENADLLADLIHTTLKLARDRTARGDLKILSSAVKELRYAFRVFAPYSHIHKVSVFGSARTPRGDPAYAQAEQFARLISDHGWMVITGAGGGIMEAGTGGAGREKSFGVAIRLPFEQGTNSVIEADKKLVNFKYFFTRKLMFVKEAEAVCLLPGGFGTHDEGFEVLTLVQTGKAAPMPIVFLDAPGGSYWREWREYIRRHLLGNALISPEDLDLFLVTDSAAEAVEYILRFYRRYHSSRYVKNDLVIRMTDPLPVDGPARLTAEFGDLLVNGAPVRATGTLPEEEKEPAAIRALPRIALPFNKRSFGRLRQMIERINSM